MPEDGAYRNTPEQMKQMQELAESGLFKKIEKTMFPKPLLEPPLEYYEAGGA